MMMNQWNNYRMKSLNIIEENIISWISYYMCFSPFLWLIAIFSFCICTHSHHLDYFHLLYHQHIIDRYNMGLIKSDNSLLLADQLTAGAFCRRRLPVVLVKLKMCQHLDQAVTLIEHGHIRVGPTCVTDPAFLVSRQFEDFVTWVDGSKIKRTLLKFHNKLDDFDNPPKWDAVVYWHHDLILIFQCSQPSLLSNQARSCLVSPWPFLSPYLMYDMWLEYHDNVTTRPIRYTCTLYITGSVVWGGVLLTLPFFIPPRWIGSLIYCFRNKWLGIYSLSYKGFGLFINHDLTRASRFPDLL